MPRCQWKSRDLTEGKSIFKNCYEMRDESSESLLSGPDISEDEVEKVMKGGKAVDEDGMAIEMLRDLDKFNSEKITSFPNKIYRKR